MMRARFYVVLRASHWSNHPKQLRLLRVKASFDLAGGLCYNWSVERAGRQYGRNQ